MTEFLHRLKGASRRQHLWGVLFYLKHYEGQEVASVSEIRAGLQRGRIRWAKTANIAQELARSGAEVERDAAYGGWSLTDTGEREVRELLGLPGSAAEADVSSLRTLAGGVPDEAIRGYIEEAITCLQAGARRAAVVFLWSGAVAVIRDAVWGCGPGQIQAALQRHNPKAKFAKRVDFEGVKDADLLQVAQDLEVYDKSEKKRLGEALDLRNDCGHPVRYRPGEKKVSSFIEDLLSVVFG